MPIQPITVGGSTVQLVTLPTTPGYRTVSLTASNKVAIVTSIFTGQTQAQRWPGADMWKGKLTLPPMTPAQADVWVASLMQLQGMTNAFQLIDPLKSTPRGNPQGLPVVDTSIAMAAGGSTLFTMGWTASATGLLLAGDYLQVGFRLYRVLDTVNADSNGKAAIAIWPSLREPPAGALTTHNAAGLFRMATNDQAWDYDYTQLSNITMDIQEYR